MINPKDINWGDTHHNILTSTPKKKYTYYDQLKNKFRQSSYLIITGVACNSACIMCPIRTQTTNQPILPTENILTNMIKGRKENYEKIEISGGEPTIRKDIFYLIEQAKKLGYVEIGVCTNGILLNDKSFCEKLVEAGMTNVTLSIYSHERKLHEAINQTPGSFDKTIAGIKNIVRYNNLTVRITTVIFSTNYKDILKIGELIKSLGIRYWKLSDMLPHFQDKKLYRSLCIRKRDMSETLLSLESLLPDFLLTTFYAFTPCIIPPKILEIKNARWVPAPEFFSVGKFTTWSEKHISEMYSRKIDICKNCIYQEKCIGVFVDYLNSYGEEDVNVLAVKHECIKT